ncbi:MAG: hypothetical protein GYA55_06720 [SAR324 cluster bacterium]|uniref:Uncharacterized protein n=1 Tax=SAR324 cluster bacterium TaxID=2024889 RepID=A0A7X9IK61_9DELT|nr:hypothetical protein [SAR324 cluster bacterium]
MTQYVESSSKTVVMTFLNVLGFPFKVLWVGHFNVLFYVLFCAGGALAVITYIQNLLVKLANELFSDSRLLNYLETSTYALYILCIPFIVVAAGLPAKIVWLYGGFFLSPLYTETRNCTRRFTNILRYTLMHPFYAVLPFIGMLVIQRLLIAHEVGEEFMLIIKIGLMFTATITVYKLLQWIFLILFTTFVDTDEIFVLQNFRLILRYRSIQFISTGLMGFGMVIAIYFSGILSGNEFLPYIFGALLWYVFSALIAIALEAGEAHAQMNGVTLRIIQPSL